jgi:hypothetical protein
MILTLERNGLIRRQPGVARSIQILVAPEDLPILNWLKINQSYNHCAEVLELPGLRQFDLDPQLDFGQDRVEAWIAGG